MGNLIKESDQVACISRVPEVKPQNPIYWKQVLVTTFTVYPLLLTASWFIKSVFPMHLLRPEIAMFFTVAVVASLMVFPVLPFITKVAGPWMRRK